jgi:hypothetical protein
MKKPKDIPRLVCQLQTIEHGHACTFAVQNSTWPVSQKTMNKKRFVITLMFLFAMLLAGTAQGQLYSPGGRLTLQSNTPVMTSDVVGASTVYYTPYVGNNIIGDAGGTPGNISFFQTTLGLSSSLTTGNIYDIFGFYYQNVFYLCTGPAWASATSRGTGAGTTEITQIQGIWFNTNAVSSCLNTVPGTCPCNLVARNSTYLGSVYMTGNGQTSMQFKPTPATGGTSNVLGLYNAYNRVRISSRNIDSAHPSWTDSNPNWELLDTANSTSTHQNTISFLDGLQQSSVEAQAAINMNSSASTIAGYLGVALDSTAPTNPGGFIGLTTQNQSPYGVPVSTFDHFTPVYGFHYIAAVEYATGSTITYIPSSGGTEELKVDLEM